jgi:hypothetical protein
MLAILVFGLVPMGLMIFRPERLLVRRPTAGRSAPEAAAIEAPRAG